jgi:hypothetical protein
MIDPASSNTPASAPSWDCQFAFAHQWCACGPQQCCFMVEIVLVITPQLPGVRCGKWRPGGHPATRPLRLSDFELCVLGLGRWPRHRGGSASLYCYC